MQFPILQSGVIVQDWADRLAYPSHAEYEFGGMRRQTIRESSGTRIVWRLRYRNLLSEEAMRLRSFVEALPSNDVFEFTDPWTGTVWEKCRLGAAPLVLRCEGDLRWAASLEVENAH